MANWQRHIRLQPEWDQCKEDAISIQQLAGVIARRLAALKKFDDDAIDDERDEIVDEFEAIAQDREASCDDFDNIMDRFYDWGDQRLDDNWPGKKVCWIDWMSKSEKVSP